MRIKKGSTVLVTAPVEDKAAELVTKYNGGFYKVARTLGKRYLGPDSQIVELEGVKSSKGVPYWFCREWVTVIDESLLKARTKGDE